MTKELDFQSHLIKAAKAEGGYGLKLSNAYQAGIPDLLLKMEDFQTTIAECKVIKLKDPVASADKVVTLSNPATALQRQTLREMHRAGINVGLIVLCESPINHHTKVIIATKSYDREKIVLGHVPIFKEFRKPWPIKRIMELLNTTMASQSGE